MARGSPGWNCWRMYPCSSMSSNKPGSIRSFSFMCRPLIEVCQQHLKQITALLAIHEVYGDIIRYVHLYGTVWRIGFGHNPVNGPDLFLGYVQLRHARPHMSKAPPGGPDRPLVR